MRSPARLALSIRRLRLLAMALGMIAILALLRIAQPSAADAPMPTALQRARNPVQMSLLTDSSKVVGWISGVQNHTGEDVFVSVANKAEKIKLQSGNTFVWSYKIESPTRAVFSFGRLLRAVTLTPPQKLPPSVFFVVDRSAYRPKQTLQFAGFLRQLNERGEFAPLPRRTVEAELTSEQRKTVVARLKLTADEQGRIVGDYTFSESDPLDRYRLSLPGYKGAAHVTLAEYRKAKTYLSISGQREDARFLVRFRGRDYLDKPLPLASVQFVAQVVRDPHRRAAGSLNDKEFAYADADQPPALRLDDLSIDEQTLAQAEDHALPVDGLSRGRERQVAAVLKGRLELNAQGEGEYPIPLQNAWRQPGHALIVQGVMLDGNGREERCTRMLPLLQNNEALRLSLSQPSYQVNEPIYVKASTTDAAGLRGEGVLTALRLTVTPPRDNGRARFPGILTVPVSNWGSLRRTAVASAAFKGDTAALRLSEPGAYVLVARLQRHDGTTWRQEIGCVVQPRTEPPALRLRLPRDTYHCGETLTGFIHSRFADACVLVTLRDSVGLRLWQTMQLRSGKAELNLKLPPDLRYGCTIEVQYADAPRAAEALHVASQSFHVVPAERMLAIGSVMKPIYEPGEKAVIKLEVNRQEPVDLIVSVYDKALLSIAADHSADVRNFYLADDRVHDTHARDVLRQRLGGMSLFDLVQRARSWLREHPEKAGTPDGAIGLLVAGCLGKQSLSTPDVAQLLRMVGVKTRALADDHTWNLPPGGALRQVSVAEWLETPQNGWRLHYSLVGDTLLLTSFHTTQAANPWAARSADFVCYGLRRDYNSGFQGVGNLGMGGVVGVGGLGGVGGIAGLGGQGFNQLGGKGGGGLGPLQANPANLPALPPGSIITRPGPAAKIVPPLSFLDSDGYPTYFQIRQDFADSAYWNARVRTDAQGRAKVEFKLPDTLTEWRVVVTAVSRAMHVGRHETSFRTAKAIMVHPIVPRFFIEGDRAQVSAEVHNRTSTRQSIRVRLKVENAKIETPAERLVTLEPESHVSVPWTIQVGDAGSTQLLMSAESAAGSDASLKRLPVQRASVEYAVTRSGFCKEAVEIAMPEGVDPRLAVVDIRFAPTLTADLLDTLDYLVDYPYGCVEQTMSRFLPAIKVAQILRHFQVNHPGLNKRLPGCVAAGIKRLRELQQPDGGWGWNGTGKTHEMMTPYALYGLLQAEKAGYSIGSDTAIERGLNRLKMFIAQMDAAQSADRIYCMYVYGHRHDLPAEWWRFIEAQRAGHKLSDYALALSLDLAVQQRQTALAGRLADELRSRAVEGNEQIHWRTAGFSRWGDDPFEITAMALKALVAYDKDDKLIPGIIAYFTATKRGNHWNSTKDTAMIVFALCDYLAHQEQNPHDRPRIAFRCNNGPIHEVPFTLSSESRTAIVPAAEVKAGSNRIVFVEGSPGMMYRLALRYRVAGRSAKPQALGIQVARRFWLLDDHGRRARELRSGDSVPRGAYVESVVEATPTDEGDMRYVLVENPRPAGCEATPAEDRRFEQSGTAYVLREERDTLLAYHHEQTSGQIIDRCVLHAEFAGEYLTPAAHVEMMYRTEVRGHSGTFTLRIDEK